MFVLKWVKKKLVLPRKRGMGGGGGWAPLLNLPLHASNQQSLNPGMGGYIGILQHNNYAFQCIGQWNMILALIT